MHISWLSPYLCISDLLLDLYFCLSLIQILYFCWTRYPVFHWIRIFDPRLSLQIDPYVGLNTSSFVGVVSSFFLGSSSWSRIPVFRCIRIFIFHWICLRCCCCLFLSLSLLSLLLLMTKLSSQKRRCVGKLATAADSFLRHFISFCCKPAIGRSDTIQCNTIQTP